jgi:thymidylate synthase
MRSNDAFVGLPHDVFSFTMLQEVVARALRVDVGTYNHYVGSLHLYDRDRDGAEAFLDEAWQDLVEMPPMPIGNPWPQLARVLKAERAIRGGRKVDPADFVDEPYWQDLIRLLQAHQQIGAGEQKALRRTRKAMHSKIYNTYIDRRARNLESRPPPPPIQGQLL